MTPEQAAYEADRLAELIGIARDMTALGLPGEDPDDPKIKLLLETGLAATSTRKELVAWLAQRAPR